MTVAVGHEIGPKVTRRKNEHCILKIKNPSIKTYEIFTISNFTMIPNSYNNIKRKYWYCYEPDN